MKWTGAIRISPEALICGAILLLAGCGVSDAVGAAEKSDRASRLYTAAMAELQAGRVEPAIEKFKGVVVAEPGNGNAHFQLAALLEDVKKDYLGAIVHYRMYLMIRPTADKAVVAQDRMRGCETRYAAALAEKAGMESQFAAELAKLRAEHEKCGKSAARLAAELDDARRKIASLKNDVEMKNRMIERAGALADDAGAAKPAKPRLRPTDADLLDDDKEEDRIVSSADIKNLRAMLEEDERTAAPLKLAEKAGAEEPAEESGATAAKPADSKENPLVRKKDRRRSDRLLPETYTVEEGDTLMKISARFYGTNKKWRDIREANREIISSDGRVKTGQVIKLP